MYRKILRSIESVQDLKLRVNRIEEQQRQLLVNQGVRLSALNASKKISSLHEVEFKVFSQWGEDGIDSVFGSEH